MATTTLGAIIELDKAKQPEKLETAELAMSKQELEGQADASDELRAIADGLYIIRMLKESRLP